MPKYRKLYTKTVESLDVNEMPDDFTRLLWVLLPLALCREGRGLDNAAWLKSRLFPLREDVSQERVYDAFLWCVRHGMIETYTVHGRCYFQVPTFAAYQGDTSKEAESDYPGPLVESDSRVSQEQVESRSVSDATTDSAADAFADAAAATDADAVAAVLELEGTTEELAKELIGEYGCELVMAHAEAIPGKNGIKNPAGFLISQLEKRVPAPSPPRRRREDRRRFIEGEFAECIVH